MKNAKLVIFDWDGTLFRSIDLIEKSILAAAKANGVHVPAAVARSIIGLGLKAAQKELFPDWASRDTAFFAAFNRAYREYYEAGEVNVTLYDGAFAFIERLHKLGKTIAVATAKSRAGINQSLEKTQLGQFVAYSRTPDECRPKPDPQMIHEILAECGIAAEHSVMIGDTTHDLKMAENAGVKAIGITYGAHNRELLHTVPNIAIVENISELAQILL